jgi:hypothetical protein
MAADIKFNAELPHAWFDLIGRFIPGVLLVVGLGAVGCFPGITSVLKYYLFDGTTTVQVATLSGLIVAAFLAGFLLSPLCGFLDRIWDRCQPLTLDEKNFVLRTMKLLEGEFKVAKEDTKDDQNRKIMRARLSALHILWAYPETMPLAALASNRDAEKLMAGSLAWASFILYAALLITVRARFSVHILLLLTIALSLLAYCHYRKRAVQTPLDGLAEFRRKREEHT